jgi:hypothetical protein
LIAALDLCAVGAGSAGQRDIQQKQVVDGASQPSPVRASSLLVRSMRRRRRARERHHHSE